MGDQYYEQGYESSKEGLNSFMAKVYLWMFLGLVVTACISYGFSYLAVYNATINALANNQIFFWSLFIVQLGMVYILSARIRTLSSTTACFMFLLYSVVLGVFISYIFLLYTMASIGAVFVVTAGVFGFMSVYGFYTKSDLTSAGKFFLFALVGIILATIVNMVLRNSMLDFVLCIIGLGVFLGLTAYDTQKIKTHYYAAASSSGEEMAAKLVIISALTLYLDFINIFLRLLRLFGKRR